MKKISNWKKNAVIFCSSGFLILGGVMQTGAITAWAVPSSGVTVQGNIVVRDDAGGNQIASLGDKQQVTITGEKEKDGYNWYSILVTINGTQTTGWVRSDLLNTDETAQDTTQTEQSEEDTEGAQEDADASEEEADEPAGTFVADGIGYEFADRIPQAEIPEDFTETTIIYNGEEKPALQFDNGELVLVYLQNAEDDDDTGLFVYDSERDSIVPFVKTETPDGYIIFTNVSLAVETGVSDSFVLGSISFESGSVMAYQQQEAFDTTSAEISIEDFYYIYGMNQAGESGWYTYDASAQTLQRSTVNMEYTPTQLEQSAEEANTQVQGTSFETDSVIRMLVGGLGAFCLLLLLLVIIISVRYRRLRRFLEDECGVDELDDPDDDDLQESFEEPQASSKVKEVDERLRRHQEKNTAGLATPSSKVDLMNHEDGNVEKDASLNSDEPELSLELDDPEISLESEESDNEPDYYDEPEDVAEMVKQPEEPEFYDEPEESEPSQTEKAPEDLETYDQEEDFDDELEFL
jgi:hypothetical protein